MAVRTFLHVGCGRKDKTSTTRGFATDDWTEVRFDVDPTLKPDIVGDMLDMSAVGEGTMDGLYSSHNIEHLYAHQVPMALRQFVKVLRPDGFAVITCPDLQGVAQLIAEDKLTEPAYHSPSGPISPLDILYGWQHALEKGHFFMAHKSGFTRSSLRAALAEAGFKRIASMRRGQPFYDLWCVATKANLSDEELHELIENHLPIIK